MGAAEPDDDAGRVHCRLDELLAERDLTLTRLAEMVGVSIVNLSVLKNDRARAIRFSTLTAICEALDCEVGELLVISAAEILDSASFSAFAVAEVRTLATMSNLEKDPDEVVLTACADTTVEVLEPREVPLGGPRALLVRRTLPQRARSLIGAWCFVDSYGPTPMPEPRAMDTPPHPHTGLQTVSWLYAGRDRAPRLDRAPSPSSRRDRSTS